MTAQRDHQISRHFRLGEFLVDTTFPNLAAELEPNERIVANLERLTRVLDELVERFPPGFEILSGYRDQKLNEACIKAGLPASKESLHLMGCAADVKPKGDPADLEAVFEFIQANADDLEVNEAVYYPKKGFLHVAVTNYDNPIPRRILMRT